MDKIRSVCKKVKSGVRRFMEDKLELVERVFSSYDKKIVIGTFVIFIGVGLVSAGVVEKVLIG